MPIRKFESELYTVFTLYDNSTILIFSDQSYVQKYYEQIDLLSVVH